MTEKAALTVGGSSSIVADTPRLLTEYGHGVGIMPRSSKGEALTVGGRLEPDGLAECVEAAMKRFGRIDGMFTCTGPGPKGGIDEISDKDWHLGLDYYLTNVIRVARQVTPVMAKQKSGGIANISTFAEAGANLDFPMSAEFHARLASCTKLHPTKHAPDSISLSNVLPRAIDSLPKKLDRVARIPAGRYTKVRELSETVALLASDAYAR